MLMNVSLKALQQITFICYLVAFWNNQAQILINSDGKVNTIAPAYIAKRLVLIT